MDRYHRWESGHTTPTAIVAYATMWGSTDLMARAIAEGVAETGAQAQLYDLAQTPLALITWRLLEGKALLLGSPTLHHTMLYRVQGYLAYLEGLKPQGKLAGAFGSFGWGGGAIARMTADLERIGFELPFEPLGQKFKPEAPDLETCREWGRAAGRAVLDAAGDMPSRD